MGLGEEVAQKDSSWSLLLLLFLNYFKNVNFFFFWTISQLCSVLQLYSPSYPLCLLYMLASFPTLPTFMTPLPIWLATCAFLSVVGGF